MTLKVPKHTGQKSHTTTSGLRRLEVNQVFEKSALKEGEHILEAFSFLGLFQYGDLQLGQT